MSLAALVLAVPLLAGGQGDIHARHREKPQVKAPGYSALQFPAPEPGRYALPPLGVAADGSVVDSNGETRRLHEFYGDKIVVLSFIYTSCPDINGCPLAAFVLGQAQRRIMENPALRERARMISLSFDPQIDTPEVMARYGRSFRQEGFDWQFLTTRSVAALDPILAGYDQSVLRDYDEQGRYLGTISHILRVFLIDKDGQIRNIYSPSFLHADILAADIETLLMDQAP